MISRITSIASRRAPSILASTGLKAVVCSANHHQFNAVAAKRTFFKASTPTMMPIKMVDVSGFKQGS
jgi:hypothetical protein